MLHAFLAINGGLCSIFVPRERERERERGMEGGSEGGRGRGRERERERDGEVCVVGEREERGIYRR